jgi:hypothetical protein
MTRQHFVENFSVAIPFKDLQMNGNLTSIRCTVGIRVFVVVQARRTSAVRSSGAMALRLSRFRHVRNASQQNAE